MASIVPNDALLYHDEDKAELNSLARMFYAHHGYRVSEGFDFQSSTHPQERLMFALACIAMYYSREFGAVSVIRPSRGTEVVNVRACPNGWLDNPEYIYCGRANRRYNLKESRFANPAVVVTESERVAAIAHFRQKLWADLATGAMTVDDVLACEGKKLVCWCAPKRCHCNEIVRAIHALKSMLQFGLAVADLLLILHALGHSQVKDLGWRNHYCASVESESWIRCRHLASLGLMVEGPELNNGESQYFYVTDAGAAIFGVVIQP